MKTTILGGALFLVPLVCLAIILTKAFQFSRLVTAPFERFFPMDRIAGVALADLIAIGLILLLCYLAGLIARGKLFANAFSHVDSMMMNIVPGYAVIKGVLGGLNQNSGADSHLRPVLVKFDDYDQIAFEIERDHENAVIFLPGAPSAWSGSSILVSLDRVTTLSIPPHQVVGLLRVLGRGTANMKAPTGREDAIQDAPQ